MLPEPCNSNDCELEKLDLHNKLEAVTDNPCKFCKYEIPELLERTETAEQERDQFRVAIFSDDETGSTPEDAARLVSRLKAAEQEHDQMEKLIEDIDALGTKRAKEQGKPYDRYTCWGEAACDLIEQLTAAETRAETAKNKLKAAEDNNNMIRTWSREWESRYFEAEARIEIAERKLARKDPTMWSNKKNK